jgi:hypothetical protein
MRIHYFDIPFRNTLPASFEVPLHPDFARKWQPIRDALIQGGYTVTEEDRNAPCGWVAECRKEEAHQGWRI